MENLQKIGIVLAVLLVIWFCVSIVDMISMPTPQEMADKVKECESLGLDYYQGGFGDVFCTIK